MTTSTREQIIEALGCSHTRVGGSGTNTTPGFVVCTTRDGRVQVSHMPPLPNPPGSDQSDDREWVAECRRMVDAYAVTIDAAGFQVERRGPRSRFPHLLVSRA
jgi:hypothetical protein